MRFTRFFDSCPLRLQGHDYRFGDAKNNVYKQIMEAAPVVATIGDESCVDVCDSDAMCETAEPCSDARQDCQNYIPFCDISGYEWFARGCHKTCGICTVPGKLLCSYNFFSVH